MILLQGRGGPGMTTNVGKFPCDIVFGPLLLLEKFFSSSKLSSSLVHDIQINRSNLGDQHFLATPLFTSQ